MSNIKLSNNEYWDWSSVVMPASSSDLTKCVNLGSNMDLVVEQEVVNIGVITSNYAMYVGSLFTANGGSVTPGTACSNAIQLYGAAAGTNRGTIPASNFSVVTQGYIRLNNGLQIMWKPINGDSANSSGTEANLAPSKFLGWGTKQGSNWYQTGVVSCGNFSTFSGTAKPFIEKPMVWAKVTNYPLDYSSDYNMPEYNPFIANYGSSTTSWGNIIGRNAVTSSALQAQVGKVITLFAVGKWK